MWTAYRQRVPDQPGGKDNLKWVWKDKKTGQFVLNPKGGGDTMELGLDPKSYDIVNFKLTNQVGGVTALKFSDIRINVALDDSLFAFTVPEGADIVRPQEN
jgi:outer membrane lipoprotein-sorting protein